MLVYKGQNMCVLLFVLAPKYRSAKLPGKPLCWYLKVGAFVPGRTIRVR